VTANDAAWHKTLRVPFRRLEVTSFVSIGQSVTKAGVKSLCATVSDRRKVLYLI
jgi:hypothetical protein